MSAKPGGLKELSRDPTVRRPGFLRNPLKSLKSRAQPLLAALCVLECPSADADKSHVGSHDDLCCLVACCLWAIFLLASCLHVPATEGC